MIAFAFLFLGLVVGPHAVELIVEGEFAAVAMRLDGKEIARLDAPPWALEVDLGDTLRPHRLVAVGLDADGDEIARASQLINLPRAPAEVAVLLEGEDPTRPTGGRVLWQHLALEDAEQVAVTLDGKPVAVDGEGLFDLRGVDPRQAHVIQAEVAFAGGGRYRTEVRFGGPAGGRLDLELTGVLVRTASGFAPSLAAVEDRFAVDGAPATVVAVEKAPAKIAVVVDPYAKVALRELAPYDLATVTPLLPGQEVEFLFPVPQRVGGRGAQAARLFTKTRVFRGDDGDLAWLLTRVRTPEPSEDQALTDALAAAALLAAEGSRPRAVVLMLGRRWVDQSAFRVDEVLEFYRHLQVPLVVWTIRRGAGSRASEDRFAIEVDTPWGTARDISSVNRIAAAAAQLRTLLDSQYTVWLRGAHLPDQVTLVGDPSGLRLAGER